MVVRIIIKKNNIDCSDLYKLTYVKWIRYRLRLDDEKETESIVEVSHG